MGVSDGYFTFDLGDKKITVSNLNFSAVTSLEDVANVITAGLPVDLAEKLVSLGDKEASQAFIDSITSAIQEQTNAEIKKRANGGAPAGSSSILDNANDPVKQALAKAGF